MHGKPLSSNLQQIHMNQTQMENKFLNRAPIPVKTPNAHRYKTKPSNVPPDIISGINQNDSMLEVNKSSNKAKDKYYSINNQLNQSLVI